MNKTMKILLAAVAASLGGVMQTFADADAASVTVEFALGRICADGSSVDGKMSLGYAPTETRNAVVAIGDEVLLNAAEAGHWTWTAQTAGTYAVSHAVGDDAMTASYVVTNGYAKVEEGPNPPMEVVEGIVLSTSAISVGASKKTTIVKVSGSGDWTAETSAEWLSLSAASGTGSKNLAVSAAENGSAEARVGYVYVAGRTLTVTQAGRSGVTVADVVAAECAGDEISLDVSVSDATTTWSARSECAWIAVSPQDGTGSGLVTLQVLPWNNAVPRVGTVTVAGQTVTVTQAAAQFDCLAGMGTNVVANGEAGTLDIRATQGIVWSATSDAAWLYVAEGGVARRGNGTVAWTAQPQDTTERRTATITVTAGALDGAKVLTFTVTQSAATVDLSATNASVVAQGETVEIDVVTASGVSWSITDVPEWITLDGESERTGASAVKMSVSANEAFEMRLATVQIAGQEFIVTQNAAKIEIEGGLRRVCPIEGADLTIAVRVDVASAPWTVEISEEAKDNWVFFLGDETITGDGTFDLYVAEAKDGTTLPRTATVTVGNVVLRITQDEGVIVTPADGSVPFAIPTSWFAQYPTLGGSTVAEWQTIAEDNGVKALPVWQDYVAGTDPTNALSKFTAKIEMKDGAPVVTWSPALNGEGVREGARVYRVWGKANLGDAAWCEVSDSNESAYRFFRVTVEMP